MSCRADDVVWDARRLRSPHGQRDKAGRVRRMFDAIAPTYELINTLASAGRDSWWRREMVRRAKVRPDDVLLDIACGTGDVARAFATAGRARRGPEVRPVRIIGLDFSPPMLQLAAGRPIGRRGFPQGDALFSQADALHLPIADASVSIATCAFGIRNFHDLDTGLREMYRVLSVGGRAVILEFAIPARPIFRRLYLFYVARIMPAAAALISRDRTGAYRYLPRSVLSFHGRDAIVSRLEAAGFSEVTVHPLSWGIVAVYVALKTVT